VEKYDVAILGGGGAGMAVTVATRDAWLPLSDFRFGGQEI
jgi:succinate dehydrogenase/fumarate reductase flavoprotein subunit